VVRPGCSLIAHEEHEEEQLPVQYRGDLLDSRTEALETATIDAISKATGLRVGLLINFNSILLKDGLRRIIR